MGISRSWLNVNHAADALSLPLQFYTRMII